MKSSSSVMQLQQRVQRNLANQLETEHLQSDIEKTCIEAGYDEHIEAYAEGMLEMKITKLGTGYVDAGNLRGELM